MNKITRGVAVKPKILFEHDKIWGFVSENGTQFKIVKKIAGGGFGIVYRVESEYGEVMALKVGKRPQASDEIRKELMAFKKLYVNQSENDFVSLDSPREVVMPHTEREDVYVVHSASLMPLIEGEDVYYMLFGHESPTPFIEQPLSHIFYSMSCFFSQLQTLHERYNSVHGDIKIENVMTGRYQHFDPNKPSAIVNYLNIVDCGLMKENVNLVTVSEAKGTQLSISPEQANKQYFFQSDIYSAAQIVGGMLGATLWDASEERDINVAGLNDLEIENMIRKKLPNLKAYPRVTISQSHLPKIIRGIFNNMRAQNPLDRPTAPELLRVFNILENVFRGMEMLERYSNAIKDGKRPKEAIAFSEQRDFQSIRSMLNDLPEPKLKIEIYKYLLAQHSSGFTYAVSPGAAEVDRMLNQIMRSRVLDPESPNRILDELAEYISSEDMENQPNNRDYLNSLTSQIQEQISLLDKINLDLTKGARRDGVDLIEYELSSSLATRPKPISQKLYEDYSHRQQELDSTLSLINEWNNLLSNNQDVSSDIFLLDFFAKLKIQHEKGLPIFDILREISDLSADIKIINDCLKKSKLTFNDHANLKKIRKKFGLRVGHRFKSLLCRNRDQLVMQKMKALKHALESKERECYEKIQSYQEHLDSDIDYLLVKTDFSEVIAKFKDFSDTVKAEKKIIDDICKSLQPSTGQEHGMSRLRSRKA